MLDCTEKSSEKQCNEEPEQKSEQAWNDKVNENLTSYSRTT